MNKPTSEIAIRDNEVQTAVDFIIVNKVDINVLL